MYDAESSLLWKNKTKTEGKTAVDETVAMA